MRMRAIHILVLGLTLAASGAAEAQASHAASDGEAKATYDDIRNTLGQVPTFLELYPDSGIAGAWGEMKAVELSSDTRVPGQYKELIGIAVASQIPCHYCTYFHTQAAKLHGATDEQIREAVAIAAQTRHWSTVMNGAQTDMRQFRADMKKMSAAEGQSGGQAGAKAKAAPVTDPASAKQDIRRTLGVYPAFMDALPPEALPGAWKMWKGVELSETAVPIKYKELIGLGVAAQVPCDYCVVAHTDSARAAGATQAEIAEALTMAAMTRHWSTVLNGNLVDEQEFVRETDQIMGHLKKVAQEQAAAGAR